jgi:transcriptional regulator with PAS, ATPase and Fis domain
MAHGGTLVLDEIGELPLPLQAKLLRVLEERCIDRLGARESQPVDARVIAITNRDLAAEVQAGRFRDDLYYRLRVFPIHVTPLRERPEDILPTMRYLLDRSVDHGDRVRVSPRAIEILRGYRWPGNVRELRNLLLEALLAGDGKNINPRDLPMLSGASSVSFQSLREVEKRHIREVLESTNWNKKKAAEILGIHRSTLYEKISEYDLQPRPSLLPRP